MRKRKIYTAGQRIPGTRHSYRLQLTGKQGIYQIIEEIEPLKYLRKNGQFRDIRRWLVEASCCGRSQVVYLSSFKNKICNVCRNENLGRAGVAARKRWADTFAKTTCFKWFSSGRQAVAYLGHGKYEWECRAGHRGITGITRIKKKGCRKCAAEKRSITDSKPLLVGEERNGLTIISGAPVIKISDSGHKIRRQLAKDRYGTTKLVCVGNFKSGRTRSFMPQWKQRQIAKEQQSRDQLKKFSEAIKARSNLRKNKPMKINEQEKAGMQRILKLLSKHAEQETALCEVIAREAGDDEKWPEKFEHFTKRAWSQEKIQQYIMVGKGQWDIWMLHAPVRLQNHLGYCSLAEQRKFRYKVRFVRKSQGNSVKVETVKTHDLSGYELTQLVDGTTKPAHVRNDTEQAEWLASAGHQKKKERNGHTSMDRFIRGAMTEDQKLNIQYLLDHDDEWSEKIWSAIRVQRQFDEMCKAAKDKNLPKAA